MDRKLEFHKIIHHVCHVLLNLTSVESLGLDCKLLVEGGDEVAQVVGEAVAIWEDILHPVRNPLHMFGHCGDSGL